MSKAFKRWSNLVRIPNWKEVAGGSGALDETARHDVVLCVDEKTGIQALDRTQPMLPLRAAKPRSWTNEYVRHGTRTLLASLEIGTGRVIAHVRKRRTSKDFLAFLDSVVKEYPNQRLAIVLDNLNTRTNEAARQWLKTHQLVSFH